MCLFSILGQAEKTNILYISETTQRDSTEKPVENQRSPTTSSALRGSGGSGGSGLRGLGGLGQRPLHGLGGGESLQARGLQWVSMMF